MALLRNASKIEQWVLGISLVVLLFSFGMVGFSVAGFGMRTANCITAMTPYEKGEVIQHDANHFEIHYVARMWSFDPPEVVLPPNASVDIYLTSADVTHGFYVPGTNINMMAVPGVVNYLRTTFHKEGTYAAVCHEYCGASHQEMGAVIRVGPFGPGEEQLRKEVPPGLALMQTRGCTACHTTDGTPSVGPTFKGLFGKQEKLADGSTVSVDEPYVRESVLQPMAKIVSGFQPAMPAFQLSDTDIDTIVDYLKNLQ